MGLFDILFGVNKPKYPEKARDASGKFKATTSLEVTDTEKEYIAAAGQVIADVAGSNGLIYYRKNTSRLSVSYKGSSTCRISFRLYKTQKHRCFLNIDAAKLCKLENGLNYDEKYVEFEKPSFFRKLKPFIQQKYDEQKKMPYNFAFEFELEENGEILVPFDWYDLIKEQETEEPDEVASKTDINYSQNEPDYGYIENMDELFTEAGELVITSQKASIGMLQRKFRIGFNRAAQIIDQLAEAGVVSAEEGTQPRKILMTEDEFSSYQNSDNFGKIVQEIGHKEAEASEYQKRVYDEAFEQKHAFWKEHLDNLTEADPDILSSLNGVFILSTSPLEKEQLVRKLLESYYVTTLKMILFASFTPALVGFDGAPHLFVSPITDPKKIMPALNFVLEESKDRFNQLAAMGAKGIKDFNNKIEEFWKQNKDIPKEKLPYKLPHIVVVFDEISTFLDEINADSYVNISDLQRLILNGRTVGVHTIFFSGYSRTAIFDRRTNDLLQEHTVYDILSLFGDKQEHSVSIQEIDNMSDNGTEFEKYAAGLLQSIGYSDVRLTTTTGDYGADIIASKDGKKYAFQCKCYSQPVGIGAVQEVYSGKMYYKCDEAVVLTNNEFTNEAVNLASATGVQLWNRKKLVQMINESQKQGN